MRVIAKKKSMKSYEKLEAGLYNAICYQVLQLGTQETPFIDDKGEKIFQNRILITWELPEDLMKEGDNSGKPFVISKEYTLSLDVKATLRKDLESWRGRAFTEDEKKGFDLENILNKACQLNVTLNKNNYPIVSAVLNKSKTFEFDKTFNDLVIFDLDNFDNKIFDKLPKFIKEKIMRSPEYSNVYGSKPPLNDPDNLDEEIPF